jgi:hypothetical protein
VAKKSVKRRRSSPDRKSAKQDPASRSPRRVTKEAPGGAKKAAGAGKEARVSDRRLAAEREAADQRPAHRKPPAPGASRVS